MKVITHKAISLEGLFISIFTKLSFFLKIAEKFQNNKFSMKILRNFSEIFQYLEFDMKGFLNDGREMDSTELYLGRLQAPSE